MSAPDETRLKRLTLRSWRRGTKEMDMILGPYADARLQELPAPALDAYEALLQENDQDLFGWVTGRGAAPDAHAPTVEALRQFHGIA